MHGSALLRAPVHLELSVCLAPAPVNHSSQYFPLVEEVTSKRYLRYLIKTDDDTRPIMKYVFGCYKNVLCYPLALARNIARCARANSEDRRLWPSPARHHDQIAREHRRRRCNLGASAEPSQLPAGRRIVSADKIRPIGYQLGPIFSRIDGRRAPVPERASSIGCPFRARRPSLQADSVRRRRLTPMVHGTTANFVQPP